MLNSILAAGITTGITDYINLETGAVIDSSGNMTGGIINTGNQAGATLSQQLTTALYESAITTGTNTALQSAVNGDSFSEALENQVINTIVMAGAKLGANAIGESYHTDEIGKATQLTLHAALGATVNLLTGNDALSGAISGVVGELAGEVFDNTTDLSDDALKQIGGLAGGLSAIITSKVEGLDVDEIADNAYSGQRIGINAVANNYLMPQEKKDLVDELNDCNGDSTCEAEVQANYKYTSDLREADLDKAKLNCSMYGTDCDIVDDFYNKQRLELTEEGNEYYNSLSDEEKAQEFVKLPDSASVFHTYQTDPNTGEVINILTGSEEGYTKYVDKITGYEVVLDSNGDIVTNALNMGTYNYYNPTLDGVESNSLINGNVNHAIYDVIPYYTYGNSSEDPTTTYQRLLRSMYNFINKN
ncbi:MAG TPA: DUF637 domain-containing protein [Rickettsiales bacterium]|nr:DUF637 domain-containing protein [Rickettsiales bacterium]